MNKHKCKLCSRCFNNGRALGGHMKSHMAILPLPPKQHLPPPSHSTLSFSSSSSSSSSSSEDENQKGSLAYVLRENPKRSFRLADPEFSFSFQAEATTAGSSVVIQEDRESETESSRNPTRHRRMCFTDYKKPKLTTVDSPSARSSVFDASPEEDVAMCLMMLSMDVWMKDEEFVERLEDTETKMKKKTRGKNRCDKCSKSFRSHQAMCVHKTICFRTEAEANDAADNGAVLFKCPFCSMVFGSGQALGGHKRSHLSGVITTSVAKIEQVRESLIDLNMPAPQEDDDFSVVSDA